MTERAIECASKRIRRAAVRAIGGASLAAVRPAAAQAVFALLSAGVVACASHEPPPEPPPVVEQETPPDADSLAAARLAEREAAASQLCEQARQAVDSGNLPRARSLVDQIRRDYSGTECAGTVNEITVKIDMGTQLRYEEAASRGREALRAGEYEAAEASLRVALQAAEAWGEESALAQSYFLLGLTKQTKAERSAEPPADVLRDATAYYERALVFRPKSGAILNNLARAHATTGDTAGAAELYEEAVAAGGEKQSLYLANYAELMAASGDRRAVAAAYGRLVGLVPDDARAHRYLADYYIDDAPDELPAYLWRAIDQGQVLTAERTALRALEAGVPVEAPEQLMGIVAVAQSRQDADPSELLDSESGRRIIGLAETSEVPIVRNCARGLLELYAGPERGRGANWWAELGSTERDPAVGLWPRDAFRELSRSIGAWHQRRGDYGTAERYYELAATLVDEEVAPEALSDLTHAYLEQGDVERVRALAGRYESLLFRGKASAYRNTQLDRIYDYHRTLGEIYVQLEQYGDRGTVNSAVFQLENARAAAETLQEQTGSPFDERDRLLFGPDLANMLARAYAATGDTAESQNTRLDAAERYRRAGEAEAADRVLAPIDVNRLQGVRLERYERIQSMELAPAGDRPVVPAQPAETERLEIEKNVAIDPKKANAAMMQQAAPNALPVPDRLVRQAPFGTLSVELSGLPSAEVDGLADWLVEHLEARRRGRGPRLPAKTPAGVVEWIRFDGSEGALGLATRTGLGEVVFAVRASEGARVPAFRDGSP